MNKLKYSTNKEVAIIIINYIILLLIYALIPVFFYLFNKSNEVSLSLFAILLSSSWGICIIWDILYFIYFFKEELNKNKVYIILSVISVALQLLILPYMIIWMQTM